MAEELKVIDGLEVLTINDGPMVGNDWDKIRAFLRQMIYSIDDLRLEIKQLKREVRLARERPPLKRHKRHG